MKAGDGVASRYLYKSNVRPKELSLRAAKAAWQSVTPAAIGGAVLCTAGKRIPTTSLRTGLGMTTGGILPPVIISIYRQRRYHNFQLSSFIFQLIILNYQLSIVNSLNDAVKTFSVLGGDGGGFFRGNAPNFP